MKRLEEFIIEIIFPIIAIVLTIIVIFLMGGLIHIIFSDEVMREQAKMIFRYDKNAYYIESYEYSEDQIVAVDVNGEEVIFPKNGTVIEYIKED